MLLYASSDVRKAMPLTLGDLLSNYANMSSDLIQDPSCMTDLCEHLHLAPRISILLGRSPIVLRVRRSGKSEWTGADGLLFSALSTDIRFWGEFREYRVMGRCG